MTGAPKPIETALHEVTRQLTECAAANVRLRESVAAATDQQDKLRAALSAMEHHFCGSGARVHTDAEVMAMVRDALYGM
uniref:Uncharacterized protein n=1 Tax=viral metagenome TaxID=1070528 RepID=A0A6M3LCQ8_9ZZZZ